MKKILISLFVLIASFAKAQDYRTDVVVLDSVSKITTYYGGSKLMYVKDSSIGGYFYLYQGPVAADGKDVITGANSSKWRRVLAANIDYTVLQVASYSALRSLPRLGSNKTYIVYSNGVNNYFRYDASDNSTADDTAMTIVGFGGARYKRVVDNNTLDVRWFGAVADDGQDDWYNLQRCLNYAVYNSYKRVSFPGGQFNLSKGLLVWKDANSDGNPEFVNIAIEGYTSAYSGTSQNETVLYANNRNSFALGIQRGKGCEVKNINFTGTNQLNYSVAQAWGGAQTYILDSQRTNAYSPYAGLVLDPFGSSTGGADRYPGFESYYAGVSGNGGSTDCKFFNIVTNGFIVGVILTPNANTQNNESHLFDGLWMTNCREGFVTTNSQERQVLVRNFKSWDDVKTVFQSTGYGANKGEPPNIDGGNIAGNIYQIFNFSGVGGYFPVISVRNIYAESFYRIGSITAFNIGFKDCHFAVGITANYGIKTQDWIYKGSTTTFDNCMILVYASNSTATPMNMIGGPIKFNNCYLGNTVGVPLNQWTINSPEIVYRDCRFYTSTRFINDNYHWSENFGYRFYNGTKIVNLGDINVTYNNSERYGPYNNYSAQYRRVTSKQKKWIYIGNVSVTVTADSATATIASLAGKSQFVNKIVFDGYDGTDGGVQVMRIRSIDGSGNVVFDRVVNRFTTTTTKLWIEDQQTLAQPYLFDYNGTTLTNVLKEGDTLSAGSTLSTSGIYYYQGQPVTLSAASAGTATPISALFNNSIKRGVLTNYDYEEFGYTYGNPLTNNYMAEGILFTAGSYYENVKTTGADSAVIGYRCIKSGIKLSSLPPEFEAVYRSKNLGSAFKLASDASNQIKSLSGGYGITLDSSVAGTVSIKADTVNLFAAAKANITTSGTYTPTITNVTNIDTASVTTCTYQKIDDIVYVYGEVTVNPTNNNADTRIDLSLPISSDFSATYQLAGNASADAVPEAMRIYANASDNRAVLKFKASDNASHTFSFAFTYKIISGL